VADRDDNWLLQLFASLGAAVAVIVVAALVLGGAALGAASLFGLTGGDEKPSAAPSLYIPPLTKPTGRPVTSRPSAPTTTEASPGEPSSSAPTATEKPRKKRHGRTGIVLTARPTTASAMERIYLSGRYPGSDGHTLQVQRFEAGWTDFPVTTTVSGGRFSTYVQTGNAGKNRFRVLDPASGKASNPVTVTVG
jgi:hypothetical protein